MALSEISSTTTTTHPSAFTTRDGGRTIVWLRGEHDASTVSDVSQTLTGAVALGDHDLVLDLSGVVFMGAATVGVVIRTRELLRVQSRTLSLRAPPPAVRRLLVLCELGNLLVPRLADSSLSPARSRIDTLPGAPGGAGDLQQRVRRGDSALLSLPRLDDRTRATHPSFVSRAVARLRLTRTARSTQFSHPV